MTSIGMRRRDPLADCDAVVVGVVEGPAGPVLATDLLPDGARRTFVRLGATGKPEQVTLADPLGDGPVVLAVGLGPAVNTDRLRCAAGAAVRALAAYGRLLVALPTERSEHLAAVAEGTLLGAYEFAAYHSRSTVVERRIELWAPDGDESVLGRAEIVGRAVNWARDLVNTSPGDLAPPRLAEIAAEAAREHRLGVEVLDETALREGGYGGIAGVGRGSSHPPRLVHLTHAGGGPRIALVGKGITFDTGGLSLKPAAGLDRMKMDMAGAAAALAVIRAAAQLDLAAHVDAWLPLAENMPGPTALRPGDVLRMRNGSWVEVRDTDNEGRLVLADALARAGEDHPDVIVDVATLTSGQEIALGPRVIGVMANGDGLRERVLEAARRVDEPAWGMPLPDHLRRRLDSPLADIANEVRTAGGPVAGGMLVAALFLREFVPAGIDWAHLDIAGPAYNVDDPYSYVPHGGTGAAVRLLIELLNHRLS